MSAICSFVLRNVAKQEELIVELVQLAEHSCVGINFNRKSALISLKQITFTPEDFTFVICDNFESDIAEELFSRPLIWPCDTYSKRVEQQRITFRIVQDMAQKCLDYTARVEIYLSDDDVYLPDFMQYQIPPNQLSAILEEVYAKDEGSPFLPCVQIVVTSQDKRQGTKDRGRSCVLTDPR